MSSRMKGSIRYWVAGAGAMALVIGTPLLAHHSFASYDMNNTIVITGVATRVNPDANHLQIFFAPMTEDRKTVERDKEGQPIIYAVDMAGSAAAAQDGVSVSSFPRGTVFTVAMHPQRNGDPAGFREGPIYKCPFREDGKAIPPEPGKHCDSVKGFTKLGRGDLPASAAK
jgi:Family of unknown function (DUF6152)